MKDMTDGELLGVLGRLLDPQFEAVLLRAAVPVDMLAPRAAPLASRAIDVVRWSRQIEANRVALLKALEQVIFENRPVARAVVRFAPTLFLVPGYLKVFLMVFVLGGALSLSGFVSLAFLLCRLGLLPPVAAASLWSATASSSPTEWTWEPADGARAAASGVDIAQPSGAPVTLRFDFGRTKSQDPRATFILNRIKVQDWSETPVLALDVHTTIPQSFEMTASLLGDGQWYEFGGFVPVTPNTRTVFFQLQRSLFKTKCAPDTYSQPADLTRVERLDLVVIPKWPGPNGVGLVGGVVVDNVRLMSTARGWGWPPLCCSDQAR